MTSNEMPTVRTDFLRTEEQRLLAATVADLAEQHLGSARVREVMVTDEAIARDAWKALAELGLVGLLVPEAHGGAGATAVEAGLVAEALGAAVAPVPFLESAVLATVATLVGGTDEDHARLLPGLASGETIGTLATTASMHASPVDGGWRLRGVATKVLSGGVADLVLVPAVDDEEELHLFAVPGDVDGLVRNRLDPLDLTRPMADLELDGVVVGSEARLGGDAGEALDRALVAGAAVLAMEQVGGASRLHAIGVEYATTRFQFGRAIGSFQAVKHTLADTLVALETARTLAWHAVSAVGADDDAEAPIAASMAKSWCSEMYERLAGDILQVHGGIGFTWESDVHLFLKRARSSKVLLGSPRTWRRRLGSAVLT